MASVCMCVAQRRPLAPHPHSAPSRPHALTLTQVGITDGFVRISCGLEDPEDLIHSMKLALDELL